MNSTDKNSDWYTVNELATLLKVSRSNVYQLIEAGSLVAYRIGCGRGCIRVAKADYERYMEGAKHVPSARTSAGRQRVRPAADSGSFKYIDVSRVLSSRTRPKPR